MSERLEYKINNWLDNTIINNNGNEMIYQGYELVEYKNFMFCNDLFVKIKESLKKKNLELIDSDEFRDKLTYLIYKYSNNE